MGSKIVWFIMGAVSGMALMMAVRRVHEEQEAVDAEALSESISRRLSVLESEMSAS